MFGNRRDGLPKSPDWLRFRAIYWWRALREGWPHLWRFVGVLALLLGGSALAVVIFALGAPLLAALVFVAGLLLTFAEGAYRLSTPYPSSASHRDANVGARRAAMKNLIGRSLRVGQELVVGHKPQLYIDAWRIHTRALVAEGYGEGEAALTFTRKVEAPKAIPRVGGHLLTAPYGAAFVNSLRDLLECSDRLSVNPGFDPTRFREFNPQEFEEQHSRPVEGAEDGGWKCPYCESHVLRTRLTCDNCRAHRFEDRAFPERLSYAHPGPVARRGPRNKP